MLERRQTDICQYTAQFGGVDCLPNGGNVGASGAVFLECRHDVADSGVEHFCDAAEAFGFTEVHGLSGNERFDGNEPVEQVNLGGKLAGGQRGLWGDVFNHF